MVRRLAVVFLIVCCGLGIATGTVAADGDSQVVEACAATPPPDFADPDDGIETIGWVDGTWYTEPIAVDASDGLSEAELERLSARTAARVEAMRCLSYETVPPVEIASREALEAHLAEDFSAVDADSRQFDNAEMETLLLIGSETDSVAVREESRSATVGGYYDFEAGQIVVVSDDSASLSIDEAVLAHELGHALQDQQFDIGQYERNTTDRNAGILGVIEGDMHRLENHYREACNADAWAEDCVSQETDAAGSLPPNRGLFLLQFQPYSDGPAFIDGIYDDGGWAAVNDLYVQPPQTALHTIEPETYGEITPTAPTVDDESTAAFDRLTTDEGMNYDVVGPAGISAMVMTTAYDSGGVLSRLDVINSPTAESPLNYDHPETNGWRGDRLYAYHDGDGETGTVWHLAWRDPESASQFKTTYSQLLDFHGGEATGYEDTYRFRNDSKFDGAVTIKQDGDRLLIVTAPTVDELTAVHAELELTAVSEDTDEAADTDEATATDETADADTTPGFGMIAVLGAIGVAMALRRRQR